jgi:hypothetical protein
MKDIEHRHEKIIHELIEGNISVEEYLREVDILISEKIR